MGQLQQLVDYMLSKRGMEYNVVLLFFNSHVGFTYEITTSTLPEKASGTFLALSIFPWSWRCFDLGGSSVDGC